jgi:hypothetical protein
MTNSIRALLSGIVDYAGLFPPARLSMIPAVQNYARYLAGEHSWMLGRFVVPASRLIEFETAAFDLLPRDAGEEPWRLSVLTSGNVDSDMALVSDFNRRHVEVERAGGVLIDCAELKPLPEDDIRGAARSIPLSVRTYFEVPIADDPTALLSVVADCDGRAKVRTGGVTRDLFPAPGHLARFLAACKRSKVAFKATAGLHHPLSSDYPMTYDPGSDSARMFGFLNVFLAAAFLREGVSLHETASLLEEESPSAFGFDDRGTTWRGHRLQVDAVSRTRTEFAISFGSCSFEEPVGDLKGIGWL